MKPNKQLELDSDEVALLKMLVKNVLFNNFTTNPVHLEILKTIKDKLDKL